MNWSDVQNRVMEAVARYGDRTDFLTIRLETSESTQIVLESRRLGVCQF
ncbi:hypothetical protein K4A83_10910 [Spirulina subsalsa FACHB-351]|uniref:Uncharacterized protein n=1 Tax=Spirulina subsalsa FACHB-351 TaxID=234711 RepID=A0ABT3L5H4_9CYAN|nr:hypothetical protein [Spirulina subsalsa]MCW6036768.1 hypothetical protein [Spirulina subsalsa FACHB-351]